MEAALAQWEGHPRVQGLATPDSKTAGAELFAEACGANYAAGFISWAAILDSGMAAQCGVPPSWPFGAIQNSRVDKAELLGPEAAAGQRLARALFSACPKGRPEFLSGASVGLLQVAMEGHGPRYPSGFAPSLSSRRETAEHFLARAALEHLSMLGAPLAAAASTGLATPAGMDRFIHRHRADREPMREALMAWGVEFSALAEAHELAASIKEPEKSKASKPAPL